MQSLTAVYIARYVSPQVQGKLFKKIPIQFEHCFPRYWVLLFLPNHAVLTLNDSNIEAMGDWRTLNKFVG